MDRVILTAIALAGLIAPGVYIGLQVAIAYTVFKFLTRKK